MKIVNYNFYNWCDFIEEVYLLSKENKEISITDIFKSLRTKNKCDTYSWLMLIHSNLKKDGIIISKREGRSTTISLSKNGVLIANNLIAIKKLLPVQKIVEKKKETKSMKEKIVST